jgi:hypothetical protein
MSASSRFITIVAVTCAVTVSAAAIASGPPAKEASAAPLEVTVYKDPNCGCCSKWVEHMRASGFKVTAHDTSGMATLKTKLGVPASMASCHTSVVDGYVIEGHVPAADIQRLLRDKPKVAGLAVPGMVTGSPGMEGAQSDPYNVMAFGDGKTSVFSRH